MPTPTPASPGPQIALHLRRDASVLALRGSPDGPQWNGITLDQLKSLLATGGQRGASIIYSRDDPNGALSEEAEEIFRLIMSYRLPIQLRGAPPVSIPE